MVDVYRELGESSRRQILSALRSGAKTVGELVQHTGLKQPNVSNHLARLAQRGIVKRAKVGRCVYYALATPEVEAAVGSAFVPRSEPPGAIDFDEAAIKFARAAVTGDGASCEQIVSDYLGRDTSLLDIYDRLFVRCMELVGAWYEVRAIDVAEEHMASSIVERCMSRVVQTALPSPRNGRTAVVGCSAENWHCIGARMIADYLQSTGWLVHYLGQNVPTASFVKTVGDLQPDVVLVSCTPIEAVDEAVRLVEQLAQQRQGGRKLVIGVGGRGAAMQRARFVRAGVNFLSKDLRSFAESDLPVAIKKLGRAPRPART